MTPGGGSGSGGNAIGDLAANIRIIEDPVALDVSSSKLRTAIEQVPTSSAVHTGLSPVAYSGSVLWYERPRSCAQQSSRCLHAPFSTLPPVLWLATIPGADATLKMGSTTLQHAQFCFLVEPRYLLQSEAMCHISSCALPWNLHIIQPHCCTRTIIFLCVAPVFAIAALLLYLLQNAQRGEDCASSIL